MKILIFITLMLVSITGRTQESGVRSLKTKSAKVTFLDFSGNGNKLIGVSNNGDSKQIAVDGVTIKLENDVLKSYSNSDQYKPAQIINSSTSTTIDYSAGSNVVLTMISNITTLTFTNMPDGGYGDIYVIQNSTGGYGISNIVHTGLTSSYPDPDGDNTPNKPVAANINSLANRKTTISYHRVGSYLLITYGNYAQ